MTMQYSSSHLMPRESKSFVKDGGFGSKAPSGRHHNQSKGSLFTPLDPLHGHMLGTLYSYCTYKEQKCNLHWREQKD